MSESTRTAKMAVAVAIMPIAVLTNPTPAAATAPRYTEYVALGDSWSADATGSRISTEFTPATCAQSAHNYPKQVAAALSIPVFRDATCGGARTQHMTTPQGTNPPQFDRLTATTDLVTLGIGGNDAELSKTVSTCLTTDPAATPCLEAMVSNGVDRMSEAIAAAAPGVRATITGIRERSPHARIVLLDYFQGVSATGGCFPRIPISAADAIWLSDKLRELHLMLARTAADSGVDFVDTYTSSGGHDACQAPGIRWAEGLIPYSDTPIGLAVPFHPNQLGADYQARRVLETLES
ncbi:SGNH/GDSL hydrolase family protein [Nocardia sp. SYP-A9097]|uniref:SGNH/GDSL hydrolase family protein n=1 Tax=Nocardia sp. SYP-A9097 TaxID=2663237 RepID=UPI00129A391E|nr:SGNH/GDSL hydrolase family protein [Nocardia sp. SYP-A9097]MRH92337.1 SGNH/GDSL hydrolase family protein [Nocardia sp. SYP-A9097]